MNNACANTVDLIDAPDFAVETGSGRATWDERGNSIWEWQTAPGVYSRDISLQQLQALEAHNLCLQDGVQHNAVDSFWSRKPRNKSAVATELVIPMRTRPSKSSGFELFLKRMGLPA